MNHPANSWIPPAQLEDVDLKGVRVYGLRNPEMPIGTIVRTRQDGERSHIVMSVGGFLGVGGSSEELDRSRLNFIRNDRGVVYARMK